MDTVPYLPSLFTHPQQLQEQQHQQTEQSLSEVEFRRILAQSGRLQLLFDELDRIINCSPKYSPTNAAYLQKAVTTMCRLINELDFAMIPKVSPGSSQESEPESSQEPNQEVEEDEEEEKEPPARRKRMRLVDDECDEVVNPVCSEDEDS